MVEYLSIHVRGNFRRQRIPQVGLESLQIVPPHLNTMGYPLALKKNMHIWMHVISNMIMFHDLGNNLKIDTG